MVDRYLTAVRGGAADRGWSLLHPHVQATMFDGDMTQYVELAAAADWSSFSWEVLRARADDPALYFIELSVESAPSFLTQSFRNHWLMWVDDGIGTMSVRMPSGGPDGIWAGGG